MKSNERDQGSRRQPRGFGKRVGDAGVTGLAAAVTHLECSA